jgi:hypothetical protein
MMLFIIKVFPVFICIIMGYSVTFIHLYLYFEQ